MCGQVGLILGRKRRSEAEIAILKTVFSGLLAVVVVAGVALGGGDGDLDGYMRRVLDAAGDQEPLPEDGEPAARAFLERLARHGLVEFVKEEPLKSRSVRGRRCSIRRMKSSLRRRQ